MDVKNAVDVSSFLLVEDSGDSEAADNGHNMVLIGDGDDGDDAKSCSCDTSDIYNYHTGFDCDDFNIDAHGDDDQCEESWCSSSKMWWSDAAVEYMSTEEGEEESSIGVNISREIMDEMDDSLFWETCLAVGYP